MDVCYDSRNFEKKNSYGGGCNFFNLKFMGLNGSVGNRTSELSNCQYGINTGQLELFLFRVRPCSPTYM